MAVTQADLDTLLNAASTGVKEVRFADGRRVIYQDATQLLAAADRMRMELSTGSRTTYAEFHRYDRGGEVG